MKRHIFHPAADAEYAAAATYFAGIDSQLGVLFYEEMERLINAIRKDPQRFWMFDPPARRCRSSIFPYAIVYVDKPDCIWILAIMHGHRQPGYWQSRMS